jgi:hypothetical protein
MKSHEQILKDRQDPINYILRTNKVNGQFLEYIREISESELDLQTLERFKSQRKGDEYDISYHSFKTAGGSETVQQIRLRHYQKNQAQPQNRLIFIYE